MMLDPTTPVKPVSDVAALLDAMSRTGFQGRKLGESVTVWRTMIEDPQVSILLGLSGAMIPAGMQECLIELVNRRYVDAIVSTGANIFHDICEHCGVRHYIGYHHADDTQLFEQGIDRIYDVFAYEEQFREVDNIIAQFSRTCQGFEGSSASFIKKLGQWLIETYPQGRSLTATCVMHNVPIFIPALCDSSIGIGLVIARRQGNSIIVDQIRDADEITALVEKTRKTGVVYIGGGVPKNFIQQTQVIASIHKSHCSGHDYAIQYTTDTPHFGGLSGCTFEEAISWGKESCTCSKVQCFCDATIALPLVTSALIGSEAVRAAKKSE
ncbi:MAG: deoxyhypusine synthase [Methanospirillum sp.]|uniref:deoxyhypusine synthase n=1 Tax=Methanospirillum sp. TaxID=45200 RepID=UPI0023706283|nr:deoxyhypusine synthase [Methanospirillum sp.]MDD1729295.1 deoxyhypusine synthase [Methanospirillum sp.]